ncbi:MAG: hypothetical protein Q8K92_08315 [Leadbetterella sp.]|nr:hypothetical protein [Leadbetterella sp.]
MKEKEKGFVCEPLGLGLRQAQADTIEQIPGGAAEHAGLNNEEMSFKQVPFGKRMTFLAKHNVMLMDQVNKLEAALQKAKSDSIAVDVAWGKKYNAMVEKLTSSNNKKYKQLKDFVIENKRWTVFLKWLEGQ